MKSLFDSIISYDNLYEAWEFIKQKNTSGGIDKITIKEYAYNLKKNINQLTKLLKENKYKPQPYYQISIPKNINEKRHLGLLTISDKIVQQAIRQKIEYRFEKIFSNHSYAYRRDKGPLKAIKRLEHIIKSNHPTHYFSCDLDNFFSCINHDALYTKLQKFIIDNETIGLIKLCMSMGSVNKSLHWKDNNIGVAQGAILSPLLSNFYLHSFDQAITSKTKNYIRYADDIIVLCKSNEEAEELSKYTSHFISNRLQLKFNEAIKIHTVNDGINFLGIIHFEDKINIQDKKHQKIIDRINTITLYNKKLDNNSFEQIMGIKAYYGKLLFQDYLLKYDKLIQEKILNICIKDQVKTKNEIKNIINSIPFLSKEYNENKYTIVETIYEALNQSLHEQKIKNEKSINKIIQNRKVEYQKMESAGMELVVHQFGAFIGISNEKLIVKLNGKNTKENITNNLRHITIIGKGISISSDALLYCSNNKIAIDFFDNKGNYTSSLQKPSDYDAQVVINQSNIQKNEKGFYLAKKIVEAKIKNQMNLMKYYSKYNNAKNSHFKSELITGLSKSKQLIFKLSKINYSEEYHQDLLVIESQGAQIYWKLFAILLPDSFDFEKRERQGASDIINSMLNYGYALLYARIWQAILIAKLHPNISFLHKRQVGKPTLVYDIIELFRAQSVDRVVMNIVHKHGSTIIKDGLLSDETKKNLIAKTWERINRYELYRGKNIRHIHIILEQCRELAKYINNESKTYKPYIGKW